MFKKKNILYPIFVALCLLLLPLKTFAAEPNVVPDPGLKARINQILKRNPQSDISPNELNNPNLQYMNLERANIKNLEGLQYAYQTTSLDLSYNSFPNLNPLIGKNLGYLAVNHNPYLNDISGIRYAVNLGNLGIRFNPNLKNSEFNIISNFRNLNRLDLGGANISSIDFLKNTAYPNLTYINLGQNKLTDINGLTHIKTLTYLNIDYNKVTDLSPAKKLPNLKTFVTTGNPR
ncbi:hypothetical protein BCR22_11895 [Enterococcus plantarum]|uniref:leucine-rich repeat domain-containing protein n=1 Tax=Enterococcus plantarum TaxID=1077675 RepID=UPI00084D50FB|nr:leucine-rich repeat domain-containing protein [Enterococcus plantarum]OEG18067.1 hypothetical protein BCR22_11895 [Enterococcus plantarum]